jgi:hypothetical protein
MGWDVYGQLEDRFSPAFWFPEVPIEALASMHKTENILPLLRQVRLLRRTCISTCLACCLQPSGVSGEPNPHPESSAVHTWNARFWVQVLASYPSQACLDSGRLLSSGPDITRCL